MLLDGRLELPDELSDPDLPLGSAWDDVDTDEERIGEDDERKGDVLDDDSGICGRGAGFG